MKEIIEELKQKRKIIEELIQEGYIPPRIVEKLKEKGVLN